MLKAEKLSDYFTIMTKKLKIDSIEHGKMMSIVSEGRNLTDYDRFAAAYTADPKVNRTSIAEELNVSRMTINRWIKKIKDAEA